METSRKPGSDIPDIPGMLLNLPLPGVSGKSSFVSGFFRDQEVGKHPKLLPDFTMPREHTENDTQTEQHTVDGSEILHQPPGMVLK